MVIKFTEGYDKYKNWLISEKSFCRNKLSRAETILSLANGYIGLRGAVEEEYPGEQRGCYIAGLFDRFADEVTELPNIPDFTRIGISLAGEEFNLLEGGIISYHRSLNLKDGLLAREVIWESPSGKRSRLFFQRFVSLKRKHLVCLKISIKPLNYAGLVSITSGFNGRVTNSGTQHFLEGDQRIRSDHSIYMTSRTQQKGLLLVQSAGHKLKLDARQVELQPRFIIERRQLVIETTRFLDNKQELSCEKTVVVFTARDREFSNNQDDQLVIDTTLAELDRSIEQGFDSLLEEQKSSWHQLWQEMEVKLSGPDFDQLALRFAQYHLIQMTPVHDSRISIGAKGLSGEGYKGHVFWDTEIFILPFFIYTFPQIARNLLIYRYHTLAGARKKASENGYRGAMFAWESAESGEETTPQYGHLDPQSGIPVRIWCGELEQHITADIAYAIWLYFQVTLDVDFMVNYGAEIFMEASRFWASRVEYNPRKKRYEINNVIGPDEYSEHVNNNAYTNYLVNWQLKNALAFVEWLKQDHQPAWEQLQQKINLQEEELADWAKIIKFIYLPIDQKKGFIEQFEGFTKQKEIDLTHYQGKIGAILEDLSWSDITGSQVLKQADVVMLLYLLGESFSEQVKRVNWEYYEPKTLHDSSLSPSIHAIVAAQLGDLKQAYQYFRQSCAIDLGEQPNSIQAGLHAASLGGIWLASIMGFAGVQLNGDKLLIKPKLPDKWKKLCFKLKWRGSTYSIQIKQDEVIMNELNNKVKKYSWFDEKYDIMM